MYAPGDFLMTTRFALAGLLALSLSSLLATAADNAGDTPKPDDDPTKVAFFEKLYGIEIEGVKPLEEYDDPDTFYSAIASQVGIPELAFEALEKEFGWKQSDDYFYAAVVKGTWSEPNWGVMVSRFPKALKNAKTVEERRALIKKMQLKFVVIDYDGNVSFPEEEKKKKKDKDAASASEQ